MSDFLNIEDDAPARRLLFTAAILLVAVPLVQSGQYLWPLRMGDIRWRWQVAVALSSVALSPFLGLSLLVLMARATNNRNVSRLVGLISAIFVIGMLGALVLFALDATQLKTIVTTAQEDTFKTASVRTVVSTLVFTVGFFILMITAFKSSRPVIAQTRKGTKKVEDGVGLIVGQVDG